MISIDQLMRDIEELFPDRPFTMTMSDDAKSVLVEFEDSDDKVVYEPGKKRVLS